MDGRIKPKKSLGQNFLVDPNIARKIAGSLRVPEGGHVVEIGPGLGALTGELVGRFSPLTAIEVDARAVAHLKEAYPDLDVRQQDVLTVDWEALAEEKGKPLYVIGNLPYYLTSQILFSLLDARQVMAEAVMMMQLEVGQRLIAVPGTKAYGILSVSTQLHTRPELLFKVSRNVFFPKPDVTSAVIRLVFSSESKAAGVPGDLLQQVIRTAFNQRRKTLRNSLGFWTKEQEMALPHGWERCRAEELAPEDYAELARFFASSRKE